MFRAAPWGGGPGSGEFTETIEKSFLIEEPGVWRDCVCMHACVCTHKNLDLPGSAGKGMGDF
jgi:hypothetical protein